MNNQLEKFYHKDPCFAKKHWSHLEGAALGLGIANFLRAKPSPLLIIVPELSIANRLEHEIKFFLSDQSQELQFLKFTDRETLPYDHFSPNEDVISQRLYVLYQLSKFKNGVLFVTASDLMLRLSPKEYVGSNSFVLTVGEELDLGDLQTQLINHSYVKVSKVMRHGEFAVRGSIIDIFPMGSNHPHRIDLFGMTIDGIRIFDVDTQCSVRDIENILILPAKEVPLDKMGVERFRISWRSYFDGNPLKSPVYQAVTEYKSYPGLEYYLPLFFESTASLFDYLPKGSMVLSVGDFRKYINRFWQEINNRYDQLSHDLTRPIMSPQDLFIGVDELGLQMKKFLRINHGFCNKTKDEVSFLTNYFSIIKNDKEVINYLKGDILFLPKLLDKVSNAKVLLVAETPGRTEILLKKLHDLEVYPKSVESWHEFLLSDKKLSIATSRLERSLHVVLKASDQEILLITETQILGEHTIQDSRSRLSKTLDSIIANLDELQIGELVVHIDYGIGRYLGLQRIKHDFGEGEYLVLEYAKSSKLYVPVTSLGLIGRYTGINLSQVNLNQLGSKQWDKAKQKAIEQVKDTAAELLEVYARRMNSQGFAFNIQEFDYAKFVNAFPFVITHDQNRVVNEVINDMMQQQPMDRLVCGDVGFGKTEIAMRAAFIAVNSSKQVAILTPTTLLAQQHFINFQDRFSGWPIKISCLSRFGKSKELDRIKQELAEGKVDIVIGTHKLIQKDINFKNLGLLVVDEEHRFGVRQKEAIKQLALNVDILGLTATPIPRTLNMAFAGIRDFSIISTPPAKRLAIKTFITEYNLYQIKEAIFRETMRGGQVYFLNNNIRSIEKVARELRNLLPSLKTAVAHGQMRKKDLEGIMNDFYYHRINVLVCTTIIESGIDVPNANTIIINQADHFGLAQLHQLRGRVGRSHHQAYAYLIVPPKALLTKDAEKRLETIEIMHNLGAGFTLATSDLEIRGAGELLGEKQSGIIQEIGFDLYMGMLKRAFKTLKEGKKLSDLKYSDTKPEFDLQVTALIPDKYIDSVNLRLVFYKRIADAENQKVLDALQVEMIDRFSILPEQTKNLFRISSLKLIAQKLDVIKFSLGFNKGSIEFKQDSHIDLKKLIDVMYKYTIQFKFFGANGVKFYYELGSKSLLEYVEIFLNSFVNSIVVSSTKHDGIVS